MTGIRRGRLAVAAAGLGAVLAGCLPAPVTDQGRSVSNLYVIFLGAAAIVAMIVVGLTIFAILRYRRGPDERLPPQIEGDLRLEAIWTGLPILTIIVLFIITLSVLNPLDAVGSSGSTDTDIRVTAFRWGWRFEYPADNIRVDGVGEPGPELVVPVGERVRITLVGEDVIHSFFVPQFLFKRDVVPGRENRFEFTVESAGTYRGQCAEYCGVYHYQMPFTVRAVPGAEFDTWITEHRGASPS